LITRYLLFAAVLFSLAGIALAAPHKWRVGDPALAKSLLSRGGKLVADYGGFQLIQADDSALTNFDANRLENEDDFDAIKLNAAQLDTRAAEIQALRKPASTFTGKRLHLVQFTGPVRPEWHSALEKTGAHIVSYIPENAYLIYGDAKALGRMQSWAATNEFVQWEGAYADDYKIHPDARLVDASGRPQTPLTDTFAIQMVDDAAANTATLTRIGQWQLAAAENEFVLLGYRNIIVRLPPEHLAEIAAQPDVVSIQPYLEPQKLDERQDQIVAGNLSGNLPSGPGYLAWLADKGFTQAQFTSSGFVVDMSDSGIDNGTTTPGHFGLYPLGNTSQASRVAYNVLQGRANRRSTLQGCDGQGTLNSHIVAGYDNFAGGFPHTDATGYFYGLGVCPFVRVGSSVIFDPSTFTNPNFTNLQTQAYAKGARISNNSWGSNVSGQYDADAQAYDALVRDVGAAGLNRQMVIVFAAGNAGPGAKTINSPGSAKNVITVGAAENVRSMTPANGGNNSSGNDGCGEPDSGASSANDIVSFSSRGPCKDGRMKPDIVAPGTHITGGVAQIIPPPSPSGLGSAISCFNASGVCGAVGSGTTGNTNNYFPLGQQFYTESSGTSHSTPAVSGACALLRQFFINAGNTPPSPAMTKAYLINSERYMTGASANDKLWSANQGMGELNLGAAFDGAWRILRDQLAAEKFTAAGQTRSYPGTVPDPTKPFRVTLAWTDAPGSTTASKELVNNLDLTVTAGAKVYKGNVFNGAFSTNGGAADGTNNVESVFLPAGAATNFTVTITAAQISADAVTNGESLPEQDFALVIYNAQIAPPVLQSVSVSNKIAKLTWIVMTNFSYRVQYKTNLTDLNWIGHSGHEFGDLRDQCRRQQPALFPYRRAAMIWRRPSQTPAVAFDVGTKPA
jgi:hypothetical protein